MDPAAAPRSFRTRVYGAPVPYKSTKHERRGRFLHSFADPDTEAWKKVVATWSLTTRPRPMLRGPLEARYTFIMPRPKGAAELHWHAVRPDYDNLSKAIGDALKGIVYQDDGRIARAVIEKVYGDRPGVEIEILELAPTGRA